LCFVASGNGIDPVVCIFLDYSLPEVLCDHMTQGSEWYKEIFFPDFPSESIPLFMTFEEKTKYLFP